MKFNIGDKVIFHHTSDRIYAWELDRHKTYIIENKAFDKTGEMYYGVKSENDGHSSTWYLEEDLVSLKKDRLKKLKKLSFIILTTSKGIEI